MKVQLILLFLISFSSCTLYLREVSIAEFVYNNATLNIAMGTEITIKVGLYHGPQVYWRVGNPDEIKNVLEALDLDIKGSAYLERNKYNKKEISGEYHFKFFTTGIGRTVVIFQLMSFDGYLVKEHHLKVNVSIMGTEL